MHRCVVCLALRFACVAGVVFANFGAGRLQSAELPSANVHARQQHPLAPLLAYARAGHRRIELDVRDYTCTLTKRERVAGKLGDYQHLLVKVRHQSQSHPFSVYLRFLAPADVKDREVLYVSTERNGDILVRRGGKRLPNMTLQLDPKGDLAMEENRYPVNEIGVKNMVLRIIEVLEEDLAHNDVKVTYFKDARLNGRKCTHFQVVHPTRRDGIRYHVARVFVDDQWQVPVYFASYDWPRQPGEQPLLLEEYVYSNMRLNVGLTDGDFERSNPAYGFRVIEQAAALRE